MAQINTGDQRASKADQILREGLGLSRKQLVAAPNISHFVRGADPPPLTTLQPSGKWP